MHKNFCMDKARIRETKISSEMEKLAIFSSLELPNLVKMKSPGIETKKDQPWKMKKKNGPWPPPPN